MTVGNPENFKVKLTSSGREEVDRRIPCDLSNLTLDKVFKWIDSQQISEPVKKELKKSASRYPQQTLNAWKNDYIKHLSKAQTKLRSLKKDEIKVEEIEERDPGLVAPKDAFDEGFENNGEVL